MFETATVLPLLGSPTFVPERRRTTKGDKHHYVPKFYQKAWVGPEGQLCEFSKPYKDVTPHRRFPDGTGYVRGL